MPRLTTFDGMAPKIDSQDLSPNAAEVAENCDLYGARIDPLPALGDAGFVVGVNGQPLVGEAATLYRAGPVWVGFPEPTFVVPDPSERGGESAFLFVRDGLLWRSSAAWVRDKEGPVQVGIAPPKSAPMAAVADGEGMAVQFPSLLCDAAPNPNDLACNPDADAPEARAYVFTYVTACDEESAPSVPSPIVDVRNGDAVALIDSSPAPANAVARRWYRAVSASDGLAAWLFVAQVPIAQPGYIDQMPSLGLGETLMTEDHYPPPDCLQGVAVLGNQLVAVWSGDQFWISEPRQPHAFPPLWRKRVRFPVLGIYGVTADIEGQETYQGYVVTEGTPYFLSGAAPEAIVPREYAVWEPGASRHCGTIMEGSLIYASINGLMELNGTDAQSVLDPESTDIEWQDFDPSALRLAYWNARLWGFSPLRSFVLPGSHYRKDRGRYLALLTVRASAAYAAPDTPLTVLQASDNGARLRQFGAGVGTQRSRWRSRVFTMPGWWSPAAAKVVADFPRDDPKVRRARGILNAWVERHGECHFEAFFTANPNLRCFEPQLRGLRPFITFRLIADGQEYFSRSVYSSEPFRVPPRRGIDWQFEVAGGLSIREVHFETSIQDLTQLGLGVGNSV